MVVGVVVMMVDDAENEVDVVNGSGGGWGVVVMMVDDAENEVDVVNGSGGGWWS